MFRSSIHFVGIHYTLFCSVPTAGSQVILSLFAYSKESSYNKIGARVCKLNEPTGWMQ